MNALATVARRARALAGALTASTAMPEQREARAALIQSLRTIALALTVLPAPPADSHGIPAEVHDEMNRALSLLGPVTGVPAHVMTYVVAPLTGPAPELPDLDAGSAGLARQVQSVRFRITVVAAHLDTEHESILRACFLSLIALHRQFIDLGAVAAADDRRPCHQ